MRLGIGLIVSLVAPAALYANVVVSTTINLTQLTVAAGAGTFQVISPFNAGAFAQAQDSLGGFSQDFHTADDSATSASSTTALANGSGAASVPALTAGSHSGVNILGVAASASSTGQGALGPAFGDGQGQFQILDANNPGQNPVSVSFSAMLSVNQMLQTDFNGVSASSEAIFLLLLPDLSDQPFLFFDNQISIGPSDMQAFSSSPTPSDSIMLMTNTTYTLIAEVDSESSGVNNVPEPAPAIVTGLGIAALLVGWRRNRANANAAA